MEYYVLCILTLLTAVHKSYSLLCYSRPCSESTNDLCLKPCESPSAVCTREILVDHGELTITEATCSNFNSTYVDEYCTHTNPRDCDTQELPDVATRWFCCCRHDYCNGFFTDALLIYPLLSVDRLLPVLEPYPTPDDSRVLVCESYLCNETTSYPNCTHSYETCPATSEFNTPYFCSSIYRYTTQGLLVPFVKGCAYSVKHDPTIGSMCHVDNPLLPLQTDDVYSCYCNTSYCNQNESFSHVIKLASYGRQDCVDKKCQHGCVVVDNVPQCRCKPGYSLRNDRHCRDIDECEVGTHDCDQKCINTVGSYQCQCWAGYLYDSYHRKCGIDEGIFCGKRICFYGGDKEDDCDELPSIHCSFTEDIDVEDRQLIHLQYCRADFGYDIVKEEWKPFEQTCEIALGREHRHCLDKGTCEMELLLNRTESANLLIYSCCCRADNCNIYNLSFPVFTMPPNYTNNSNIMMSSTMPTMTSVSVEPVTVIDESIISVVGGVICLLLATIAVSILVVFLYFKRKWAVRKVTIRQRLYGGMSTEIYVADVEGRKSKMLKVFNSSSLRKCEMDLLKHIKLDDRWIFLYFEEPCTCQLNEQVVQCLLGFHGSPPRCSLNALLKIEVLTFQQMSRLVKSLIEGVAYLHDELRVANQVINSYSCLVDYHGEKCVIVDMEHTVKDDTATPPPYMVNDIRYLSPELINHYSNDETTAVDLPKCDMYSFGIIVWEMMSRSRSWDDEEMQEYIPEYEVPFFEFLPKPNISLEDMLRMVVTDMMVPSFPSRFINQGRDSTLLVEVIRKCFYHNPSIRPTATIVRNQLENIFVTTHKSAAMTFQRQPVETVGGTPSRRSFFGLSKPGRAHTTSNVELIQYRKFELDELPTITEL